MLGIRIKKLFTTQMFGDLAAGKVVFHAFDKHGHHIVSKELHGKVGTPDEASDYVFRLCERAHEVRCDIPEGVTCQWQAYGDL